MTVSWGYGDRWDRYPASNVAEKSPQVGKFVAGKINCFYGGLSSTLWECLAKDMQRVWGT